MATDSCTSILALTGNSVNCISVLGALNVSINSREDICLMYNEALRCVRNEVIKTGATCNMDSLHATLIDYSQKYADYLKPLDFQQCNVTNISSGDNICDDMDRLGLFISIACGRSILGVYSGASSAYICSTVSSLKLCASQFLHYDGVTCDDTDIQLALTSNATTEWLHQHFPQINLQQCFTTFNPDENQPSDPRCSDSTFILGAGASCLSLGGLNSTLVEESTRCKAYFLTLRCLQHVAQDSGFHCKVNTIETTLTKLHFDYAFNVDSICHAAVPQLGTVFDPCHDDTALLQISALNPYCNPYLTLIQGTDPCSQLKSGFTSCAVEKMRYSGYSCSNDDIWRAIGATANQAWLSTNFPQVNVRNCYHG